MRKRFAFVRVALVGLTLAVCATLINGAYVSARQASDLTAESAGSKARADIVVIDRKNEGFNKRSKPQVIFLHEQHTAALGEDGKKCVTCHTQKSDGKYDFNYKDSTGLKGDTRKDLFHASCVKCHSDMVAAGKKSGPADVSNCASCHADAAPAPSSLKPVRMPLSLHAVHIESKNIKAASGSDNCSTCHHAVSSAVNGVMVEAGKEKAQAQPCFACHTENALDKRPALEVASHQTCVSCHANDALNSIKSGPTKCESCHAASIAPEKADNVKRLDRGQPDMLLVTPVAAKGEKLPNTSMAPVAFNHKAHEAVTENCSTCHHTRISNCGTCHTQAGSADAKFVNIYQANHSQGFASASSLKGEGEVMIWGGGQTCTGCHIQTAMTNKDCAGCHYTADVKPSQNSCNVCHIPMAPDSVQGKDVLDKVNKASDETRAVMAASNIARRDNRKTVLDLNAIPEEVVIGSIANEYEPSKFPHGKIVRTLLQSARSNKLASAFHNGDLLACAGCHHNSPLSLNPPACSSCHSKDAAVGTTDRLPLKAAYHQQCMSCHDAMKVEKPANTDCAGCHAPAKK